MIQVPALRGEALPEGRVTVSDVDLSLSREGGRARQGFVLAVRDSRFKLVHASSDATRRLYDLHADPLEERDVAASHPDVMARLSPPLDAAVEQRLRKRGSPNSAAILDESRQQQLKALGYLD